MHCHCGSSRTSHASKYPYGPRWRRKMAGTAASRPDQFVSVRLIYLLVPLDPGAVGLPVPDVPAAPAPEVPAPAPLAPEVPVPAAPAPLAPDVPAPEDPAPGDDAVPVPAVPAPLFDPAVPEVLAAPPAPLVVEPPVVEPLLVVADPVVPLLLDVFALSLFVSPTGRFAVYDWPVVDRERLPGWSLH